MKTKVSTPRSFLSAASRSVSTVGLIAVFACGAAAQQWIGPDASNNISNANSGNVGIGTNSPTGKLDVVSTAATTQITLKADADRIAQIGFYHGGTDKWYLSSRGTADAPNHRFAFFYNTGSGYAERLTINSSGNVGIGMTSPTSKFVVQNGATNGVSIGAVSAIEAIGFNRSVQDGAIYDSGRYAFQFTNNSPANTLILSVFNGAGTTVAGSAIAVNSAGNVGIGTTTPQSNLQIGSQTSGQTSTPVTLSLGGSFSNSAGANLKLKLYDDGVVGNAYGIGVSSGSMDFGVSSTASYHWYAAGVNKMTLTTSGDLSVSGSIAAKYQDLAEWVPSAEQLSAGTVVVLDTTKSNQVVSSNAAYDTRVAGVISAQPGITLGESGAGKVLVATTGRVRVKVDASRGPIQIGDLLVTSDIPGVAMKSEAVNLGGVQIHRPGTIVGKALEPLAKGKGEILVLLSLQ